MFDLSGESDSAVRDLTAAARALAASSPATVGDDDLMATVAGLEHARRLLDAAECAALAELDARDATDAVLGLSTHAWLAHETELPSAVARSRVRVGVKLRRALPEVAAMFADGRIGFDHARVLADATNPRNQVGFAAAAPLLADGASGTRFEVWQRDVRALADALDADGGHEPDDDPTRNRLSKAATLDDTHVIRAQLHGLDGEIVFQTIDTIADELFRQHRNDEHVAPGDLRTPPRATLEALALVEMARRARATDLDASKAPVPEVTVVINAEEPTNGHTPGAVPLQDGTTRHLLCDSRLFPIVVDSLGRTVDLGRASRFATPHQRRAAALRDGTCIWPGCSTPIAWCDLHHATPWDDDGTTDTDLMAHLCRHHHQVIHRPGWQLHATGTGQFWIRTPITRFWAQQHGRTPTDPLPLDTG